VAVPEDGGVALLPIKPEFADAILAGTKRVEFRKSPFRRDVSWVVIYASTPIQRVVGWFRVSGVDTGTPGELWERHERHGGIAAQAYHSYFADRTAAIAIGVADVTTLPEPIPIAVLGVSVPQSFRYLGLAEVRRLNAATTRFSRSGKPPDSATSARS
jgi:predicted transcriptional regulator